MIQETKGHVKPLPTGCRISKSDRKKLNAAIARTIHRVDGENRAAARWRLGR
jgi:hypothetical protein